MDKQIIVDTKEKMMKALQVLKDDLGTIRTGRATPALVENVVISAYENTQHLRLKEMATITTDGPRMIIIAPFDPSIIKDIERGINVANIGFSGYIDGHVVRINIPTLTQDRREEYIKLAHTKVEGGRVMVRQIRHEIFGDIKKQFEAKELSEDDKKYQEKEVQKITDEMMAEIDLLREKKEVELREI